MATPMPQCTAETSCGRPVFRRYARLMATIRKASSPSRRVITNACSMGIPVNENESQCTSLYQVNSHDQRSKPDHSQPPSPKQLGVGGWAWLGVGRSSLGVRLLDGSRPEIDRPAIDVERLLRLGIAHVERVRNDTCTRLQLFVQLRQQLEVQRR